MLVFVASPTNAQPVVEPGSEGLCAGYDETVEGVWMDPSGYEMLRFRVATNAGGTACYAWLNHVASWNIGSVGQADFSSFELHGNNRRMTNGTISISFDPSTGGATYERRGQKTYGKLLE